MSDERLSLFRYSARLIAGRGDTHDTRCISKLLSPGARCWGFFCGPLRRQRNHPVGRLKVPSVEPS